MAPCSNKTWTGGSSRCCSERIRSPLAVVKPFHVAVRQRRVAAIVVILLGPVIEIATVLIRPQVRLVEPRVFPGFTDKQRQCRLANRRSQQPIGGDDESVHVVG